VFKKIYTETSNETREGDLKGTLKSLKLKLTKDRRHYNYYMG